MKARQIRDGHPNKFGDKKCAHYVVNALGDAGIKVKAPDSDAYAKDCGPSLEAVGFKAVAGGGKASGNSYPPTGYKPQAGDVTVIHNYPKGDDAGHIAMYDGKQWISDFRQRDMWSGKGYRKYGPPYVIYRKK